MLFSIGVALMGVLVQLFTGRDFDPARDGGFGWALVRRLVAALPWLSIGMSGRTVGKGSSAFGGGRRRLGRRGRRAGLRALAFPFGCPLGLGSSRPSSIPDGGPPTTAVAGTLEVVDWARSRRGHGRPAGAGARPRLKAHAGGGERPTAGTCGPGPSH